MDLKGALGAIESAYQLARTFGSKLCIPILLQTAKIYEKLQQYNKAVSYYHEILFLDNDTKVNIDIYQRLAHIYKKKGYINIVLFFLTRLINSANNLTSREKIQTSYDIVSILLSKGNFLKAEEIITNSHKWLSSEDNDYFENWENFQIALTEFQKGNWQSAESLFKNLITKQEMAIPMVLKAQLHQFLGDTYRLTGKHEDAKNNLILSLSIFEQLHDTWSIANNLNKLGLVYFQEGDLILAHSNFQRSIAIYRKLGDSIKHSEPIFNLIQTELELKAMDQVKRYLSVLKAISELTDDQLLQQRLSVANALYLKKQPRLISNAEAQQILVKIVDQKILDPELHIIAIKNLCEILLAELYLYQQKEVLNKIIQLSNLLIQIASNQRSSNLEIEVIILQARLSLISGDINQCSNLLKRAENLAEDANLVFLKNKITEENHHLLNELDRWNNLNTKGLTIRKSMEISDIQSYMESLLKPNRKAEKL